MTDTKPKTIDLTPRWQELVCWMMTLLETSDNEEAKAPIRAEFQRMARAADSWVAHCKEVEND